MPLSFIKRAAPVAALFAFAVWALLPADVASVAPAIAKMRVDRLTIEKASGGPPVAFEVELAATDQEKAVGLMFRTALADSAGMLFPYGAAQPITMWMRNTYIPLDMLFIQADGVIHRIEVRAEPLSERIITSGAPVSAVLELAGGASERLGIRAGDRVRHSVFDAGKSPGANPPK